MSFTKLSRRGFVQILAAASAASSIPSWLSASTKIPARWDESVDVVIVGSGFAGLAAALEARLGGAEVMLLEKMPAFGGNSAINGGILAVPGSPLQKKLGIKDSPKLMMQDMIKAGDAMNHPEKVRALCNAALATYQWTVDELGVQYQDKNIKQEGGHTVPRSLFTINGSGSEIVNKELAALARLGVKPRLRTIMDEIIVNDAGRVVGVKVREGYRFPDKNSGKVKYIAARRGLVLCYGGFSADAQFRQIYDPKLTSKFDTTNQPGATSEGWRAAMSIGAHVIQADQIQILPQTSPDEKGFGVCPKFVESSVGYGLMVDPKTGRRFVNETGNRKVRSDAILLTGHPAVLLVSEANIKHVPPSTIEAGLKNGAIRKFADLGSLAAAYGIDAGALGKSVARWNEAIAARKDPDYAAKIFDDTVPNEGTFYACRLWPRVHYCMGGLAINTKAEVISTDLAVIPGLYAAGEATGGVHGMVRLGTVSIADCLVFGRVAGRNAARRAA